MAKICPSCGLCCNGVLFGDVELQTSDNPQRLTALGIELQRKGRKLAFTQPCACFEGNRCGIYADRPARCRAFECGVLKRLDSGELSLPSALRLVEGVKRQAQVVRDLLHCLGCTDEALPLSERYSRMMSQPMDLAADDQSVEARARLMLAVDTLMKALQKEFLA